MHIDNLAEMLPGRISSNDIGVAVTRSTYVLVRNRSSVSAFLLFQSCLHTTILAHAVMSHCVVIYESNATFSPSAMMVVINTVMVHNGNDIR